MMPANLFCLQLAASFGNRRRFLLRLGISVLLSLPFILVAMPGRAQTVGLVMVIIFTSFFGAAIGHAQLRHDLRLARLTLLPTSRSLLSLDLLLASMVARIIPAATVLICFLFANAQDLTPSGIIHLFAWLCAALLLVILLGMGAARLARSNGEVHLFGMLICAALAFISGLTPLPAKLTPVQATAFLNPIARLHTALENSSTSSASLSSHELVVSLLIVGVVALLVAWRCLAGWDLSPRQTPESSINCA